jgi:DNA invertase Pin-like site-specific DNA recombinase
MRVFGYIRVSTQEQASSGAGLEAQRAAIIDACRVRDLELVEIFEDAGFTAANLNRPAIADALESLRAKRAEGLVVAKLDRLSRSLLDFANLMESARSEGWALIALDLGVDTSSVAGELIANILASFAQFERKLIGQRTREGLAAKRAAGVRLGRPRNIATDVVERIVSERAAGRTLTAIAEGLTSDGVPTAQGGARWHASTVRAVVAYGRS